MLTRSSDIVGAAVGCVLAHLITLCAIVSIIEGAK